MKKYISHPEYTFDPNQLPDTEDAVILIDKPAGISSFGVVAKVRGALKLKFGHKVKVGHTGTLDPFATGLLILLSGKMTKKSSEFLKLDKTYEATLRLGYTSTTGDPEGEITEFVAPETHLSRSINADGAFTERPSPVTTEQRSEREPSLLGSPSKAVPSRNETGARERSEIDVSLVLSNFIGTIPQTVPKFSAVKINGERAYRLARKGKDFETPTRKVTIYEIDLLNYEYPELKIKVHCSSGTYIRTLAEDIGKALGTGAYLTALRRTEIGTFSIKDAIINLC
ncbi:tRNA pseudouridine(55) synthase TruB [Candidatus Saccharibacteria bacterium]|nr:tRNA pseudouridine(55) synthase TruB [Candidatus Saccharibacteria bacterium]